MTWKPCLGAIKSAKNKHPYQYRPPRAGSRWHPYLKTNAGTAKKAVRHHVGQWPFNDMIKIHFTIIKGRVVQGI